MNKFENIVKKDVFNCEMRIKRHKKFFLSYIYNQLLDITDNNIVFITYRKTNFTFVLPYGKQKKKRYYSKFAYKKYKIRKVIISLYYIFTMNF